MHLTLVSISRKVLDLPSIEWVTIPTRDGEITVLPNHEPLITALTPGILIVRTDGKESSYAIGGGVAEITANSVTITADMVEDGENLDIEAIRAKKEEARTLLGEYKSKGDVTDMETYIELEQQFLKESAKEQLATRN
ncbi:MAG: F0F1 ATP synthase subunit epsilon [uncultured bacterium (gcode 4)]|uniref:ATP synthase epsilon chain n=1 Tax=uncultured bacterium (gcode 4) TaxID=1234023 RepID=K1XYI5_9BACT|nr:MAG: F0F1 ATP synthase subunit epsilon [uncultured bacterium (gcode 4)]HBB26934.1 ATP synthase F1 subunit epsilon [Candidatus Gracilibacteria bacterium]